MQVYDEARMGVVAQEPEDYTHENITTIDWADVERRIASMTVEERDNCAIASQYEPFGEDWVG
jgi:hypothetical protein